MRQSRFSFVVPVFNEEDSLPPLLDRLRALMDNLDAEVELILVDDGSTDRSAALIRSASDSDPRIKLLQLSRNFGHQIAITAGIDFASGDAVAILDADLQHPPETILEMIEKWRQGAHIVYGVRTARHGDTRFKRMTASLFYRIMRLLMAPPVPLEAGDFRLLDRSAVETFRTLREHNRFVRGLWAWMGFRQDAVYYEQPARARGESKYPFSKMVRLAIDGIISFSDIPLRFAILSGAVISFLSFCYGCHAIYLWLRGADHLVPGWSSLTVAVSFLGGVHLILLGIVALYIGRIHEEVKNRPLYIVSDVVGINEIPRIDRAVIAQRGDQGRE